MLAPVYIPMPGVINVNLLPIDNKYEHRRYE
ncbi:MAG: hypothetical protein ACJAUL_001347 [Paraglaciecola sp.]|jgi:hypothetical protein